MFLYDDENNTISSQQNDKLHFPTFIFNFSNTPNLNDVSYFRVHRISETEFFSVDCVHYYRVEFSKHQNQATMFQKKKKNKHMFFLFKKHVFCKIDMRMNAVLVTLQVVLTDIGSLFVSIEVV